MSIRLSNKELILDGNSGLQIITGKQGKNKVLVSDSEGTVEWLPIKSLFTSEHYIGELYGGGIVAAIWVEGNEEKLLIAYPTDVTTKDYSNGGVARQAVPWTNNATGQNFTSILVGPNAQTNYDGYRNTTTAKSILTYPSGGTSDVGSAVSFLENPGSTAQLNGYGYNDWYLPSIFEMKALFKSANTINRIMGDDNFKIGPKYGYTNISDVETGNSKYWTSTENTSTSAYILAASSDNGQNFKPVDKTTLARIRPVRLERTVPVNGLVTILDAGNKISYNDSKKSNKWTDARCYGLTSSFSFSFASTNSTGPTYSTVNGGHLSFNGSSYIDFNSLIGSSSTVTVEMWAKLGSGNKYVFGWNLYGVRLSSGNLFGYHTTANGDIMGINSATVNSLGLVGNWNHYVFEMRSDVSYTSNKMWINGVLQVLTQQAGTELPANRTFNGGLGRIGGARGYATSFFDGQIATTRVYKRALVQTEVTNNFNNQKRRFGIVNNTHYLDGSGSGTFSVYQNMTLRVNGKENMRVLRSSSTGTASWVDKNYLFYRPDNQRFVGELYGGGIIVSMWNGPNNIFNYLIMSLEDLPSSVWSNVSSTLTNQNTSTNIFRGDTNTASIISQSGHTTSAAKLCDDYSAFGFTDWYLPSLQELRQAFKNLYAINYTLGDGSISGSISGINSISGTYWTSTEQSTSNACTFNINNGSGGIASKSTSTESRAFRKVSITANYKTWSPGEPWSEPTGDWFVNPWDEKNWKKFLGISSSNLQFHFNTNNYDSYKGVFDGQSETGNSLVGGFTGNLLNVYWSGPLSALSFGGTHNLSGFATGDYIDFGQAGVNIATTGAFTIEAWIMPNDLTTGNTFYRGVFTNNGIETNNSPLQGAALLISSADVGKFSVRFRIGNNSGYTDANHKSLTTNTKPLTNSKWSHVVAMHQSGNLYIYVNGVLVSGTVTGTATTFTSDPVNKIIIGCVTGGTGKFPFNGSIGAIRFYNRILSDSEIKDNFENDRVRYGVL